MKRGLSNVFSWPWVCWYLASSQYKIHCAINFGRDCSFTGVYSRILTPKLLHSLLEINAATLMPTW